MAAVLGGDGQVEKQVEEQVEGQVEKQVEGQVEKQVEREQRADCELLVLSLVCIQFLLACYIRVVREVLDSECRLHVASL